jgi:hypothetical protein
LNDQDRKEFYGVPELKSMTKTKSEGIKLDQEKLRYDLVPAYPLEQIVKVLTFGAKKYTDRNWELGMNWTRVFAALMRHSWAWFKGEDVDKETGISHIAHAACCCMFLLEYTRTKKELDDRPK